MNATTGKWKTGNYVQWLLDNRPTFGAKFRVGEKVAFTSDQGVPKTGTVLGMNRLVATEYGAVNRSVARDDYGNYIIAVGADANVAIIGHSGMLVQFWHESELSRA